MNLFFDTVWKLHIGELPERCTVFCKERVMSICRPPSCDFYEDAIATIKQNALTIGNPELIPVFPKPHINGFIIPKNFKPGEFYKWVGGYETKEIKAITKQRLGTEIVTSVVAILTLPEEKKNTMENNEDDRRGWPEEEEPIKNNPPTKGYSTYTNPASGSVAAPKEEPMIIQKSIIPFLLGEDSYDGYWWDQKPIDKRPPFWWRTKLREEVEPITDLQINNAALETELTSIRQQLEQRDELIKELLFIVILSKPYIDSAYIDKVDHVDSLIKKSQKL